MIKKWSKAIVCIIAFIVGLGMQMETLAVGNFQLPAAGMGLLFEEGISMGDISSTFGELPIDLATTVTTKSVDELLRTSSDNNRKQEEEDFSNLVIAQVDNYVNVRSTASEEGDIVGKLYNDSVGELLGEENGWCKIESGNVIGYVKKEFVLVGEEAILYVPEIGMKFATVNTQTLFIRGDHSLSAEIIGMCPKDEELLVESVLDDWIQVSVEAGNGYVASEYVTLFTKFVEAESKEEEELRVEKEKQDRLAARQAAERTSAVNQVASTQNVETKDQASVKAPEIPSAGNDMGAALVEYAMQFLGNSYVYGGTSLTNGTDCSGFTQSLYKNYGVDLPRGSTDQRSVGTKVEGLENAQLGDIICYSGHVALYIGDGNIIHASTPKKGIVTGGANYRTILSIRRIF